MRPVSQIHRMSRGLAAAALLGIAGCTTVGPDFVAPEPDPPPEWSQPLGAGIEAAPGELAEWLRSGLQIRVHRFDSGTRLHFSESSSPKSADTILNEVLGECRTSQECSSAAVAASAPGFGTVAVFALTGLALLPACSSVARTMGGYAS